MPAWIKENWFLIAFLGIIVTAFVVLHSKPSDISNLDELNGALTSGQPTVVTFYSNF